MPEYEEWVVVANPRDPIFPFDIREKDKQFFWIASVFGEDHAKIIAAAPKMYKALKKIARMNICDSAFMASSAAKKVIDEVEGGNEKLR